MGLFGSSDDPDVDQLVADDAEIQAPTWRHQLAQVADMIHDDESVYHVLTQTEMGRGETAGEADTGGGFALHGQRVVVTDRRVLGHADHLLSTDTYVVTYDTVETVTVESEAMGTVDSLSITTPGANYWVTPPMTVGTERLQEIQTFVLSHVE